MTSRQQPFTSLAQRPAVLAAMIVGILLTSGAIVYWQGRAVLVTRIEEQRADAAAHRRSLLEQELVELVVHLESLAAQPVMTRILDDDEDHEIAELLEVVVGQSKRLTEITCFDSDGRTIASTNPAGLASNTELDITRLPDGRRYVLVSDSGIDRLTVPIVQEFDELEQIGLLTAVIDRRAILHELNAWWVGLISESGQVITESGPDLAEHIPARGEQFTHPGFGVVRLTRLPVKMPEGGVAPSWILADAATNRDRYDPVRVLGWMIALTTILSSALVLAVVYHFSREGRRLSHDLAEQCVRLEETTLELEGQKEEAELINQELSDLNQQLEEAETRAILASQAKSEFLANMSHEIRTPMTAILGFAENMLDANQSEPDRLNGIHVIQSNGAYLLELINDILDLSKIEAGKMTIERRDCRPCHVVAEVASLMRVRADAKGLQFDIEYVGAIPEAIQSDSTRLRQILINVVGNAIKFTEAGSIRITIRFVNRDNPYLQMDVSDSGHGMTEEQVANLFQPFMQADASTTRVFGGTGLGLTISKRFAELLGGDLIVARAELGIGSTFRITLDTGLLDGVKMLDDPMLATVVTDHTRSAAHVSPTSLKGFRILLAEDNPTNQILISGILKKSGAEVIAVADGRLAVDAVQDTSNDAHPFDCILMDIQMPVMDGYEATGKLRQHGFAGPIIALTANAMDGDRHKCIQAGCDDFATKPIDRQRLIETILSHIHATAPQA